jgi:hypothetical protein
LQVCITLIHTLCPAALGLGAVHCINAESQRYRARKQRNSAGAEKWMDIRMWDSSASCIQTAKAAGYHVVATHFDPDAVSIHDVDWTQPTAVILGNEREGDSKYKVTHFCLRRNSNYAHKLLVHLVLPVSGSAVVARVITRALSLLYVKSGCAAALCICGRHLHLPSSLPSNNISAV